ncbi:MAG: twin-arginine translocase TatA/TatE family subunit [Alphaproteobacteria bacterium]|nr:MAG: twin-arginine translocase TatA/TatE family subunit [Alphaproteobacteria bacterium]
MSIGIWQIIIVAIIVVLLFGRGKISELMGDVAKGITSFKKGLREAEELDAQPAPKLEQQAADVATPEVGGAQAESEKDKAATPSA